MPFSRLGPVTRAVSQQDFAGGRRLEPADHAHDGGLAAARRADKHDELAFRDRQRQRLDDRCRAAALVGEDLRQRAELDEGAFRHRWPQPRYRNQRRCTKRIAWSETRPMIADRQDAGEDFRRLAIAPRRPEFVADAGARGDDLGDDQVGPAPAERDAQAVDHVRQHGAEEHVLHQRAVVRAERPAGLDELLRHAPRVIGNEQHELEEGADPQERDLRAFADAEPDQRKRHQRRHRQIADEVDERLGECADGTIARSSACRAGWR